MVRHLYHTLKIVDPESGRALKEYVDGDKTWVEGRPGRKYQLRLISHRWGSRTLAKNIMIDGNFIGYFFQQGPVDNMDATLGPILAWREQTDSTPTQAFEFTRAEFTDVDVDQPEEKEKETDGANNNNNNKVEEKFHTGKIAVSWWLAEDTAEKAQKVTKRWKPTNKKAQGNKKAGVGALKSAVAVIKKPTQFTPKARNHWVAKRKLYTITIHYCERAGLVAKGLAMPPKPEPTPSAALYKRKKENKKKRKAAKRSSPSPKDVQVTDLTQEQEAAAAASLAAAQPGMTGAVEPLPAVTSSSMLL